MRKLKLEELAVESFSTAPEPVKRGTVRAHVTYLEVYSCDPTCQDATCGVTCPNTCPYTCDQTCNTCDASCGCEGFTNACVSAGCGQLTNTCRENNTCFGVNCGEQ